MNTAYSVTRGESGPRRVVRGGTARRGGSRARARSRGRRARIGAVGLTGRGGRPGTRKPAAGADAGAGGRAGPDNFCFRTRSEYSRSCIFGQLFGDSPAGEGLMGTGFGGDAARHTPWHLAVSVPKAYGGMRWRPFPSPRAFRHRSKAEGRNHPAGVFRIPRHFAPAGMRRGTIRDRVAVHDPRRRWRMVGSRAAPGIVPTQLPCEGGRLCGQPGAAKMSPRTPAGDPAIRPIHPATPPSA